MSNKNRNLIVAYFDSVDAADAAAVKLKLWDKDHKEIKLGGMGIITLQDGKLKTHKVGARGGYRSQVGHDSRRGRRPGGRLADRRHRPDPRRNRRSGPGHGSWRAFPQASRHERC